MITIYLKQYNKIVRNADIEIFEELGYDDILWIDLVDPTLKEQRSVESFMDVNLQTRQQIEEIESSSKYFETESAVFSNSNFIFPTEDGYGIEPISCIVSEGIFVSKRNTESRTFNEVAKRLQINARNFPTGYHLLISMLEVRIDYDADIVEALTRQIAQLSKEVTLGDKVNKGDFRRISLLQQDTMLVREVIFDRQRALSGILRSERFPNDIYPRLSLMIKDVNSLLNHTDFNSERLDKLQDTALGLINIEQNNVTKIFTVGSLFFMPPTLIASVYGMNFVNMPELKWNYGYVYAIGMMIFVMIITYTWLKWKKWL